MSEWSKYGAAARAAAGGGKFARLKDGDKIKFVVMGTPGERHQVYNERTNEYSDAEPGTPGVQVSIGVPVYDVEQKAPRLLQLSPGTFSKLSEKFDEFGADRIFRVSRKGSGKNNTKYEVDHVEKADPTLMQTINREEPVDLVESGFKPMRIEDAGSPPPPSAPPAEPGADDVPF